MLLQGFCFCIAAIACAAAPLLAQPANRNGDAAPLVVKNQPDVLPDRARLRLGQLGGYRYTGKFSAATMSADGKLLAVGLRDEDVIKIVDLGTGKLVRQLKGAAGSFGGLAFSPDGQLLAEEGLEVLVWSLTSGELLHRFANVGVFAEGECSLHFSEEGKLLAVGSHRFVDKNRFGEVKVWDTATGKRIGSFDTLHYHRIRVAVAPDGKTVASWGMVFTAKPDDTPTAKDEENRRTLQIWDLAAGKELRRIKVDTGPQSLSTIWDGTTCAAYAPDGKTLAIATGGIAFHLIDVETGKETRRFFGRRSSWKTMLRFSPDGRLLVAFDPAAPNGEPTYDAAGDFQGWDVKTGQRLDLAPGPKTRLLDIGFPGNGRVLVLGKLAQTLFWWDASVGKNASPFRGPLTPTVAMVFAPDGKSILTAARDQHRVFRWNAKTGALMSDNRLISQNPGRSNFFEFSPNARFAVTHSYAKDIRVWDLEDGRSALDIEGFQTSGVALAFSPDSKRLAAPGFQTPLHQWEIETGQELPRLPSPAMARRPDGARDGRMAFSPDGKIAAVDVHYFANPGFVDELILCDTVHNKVMHRMKSSQRYFRDDNSAGGLAFSRDGKLLAISEEKGVVILMSVATGKEVRRLETKRDRQVHLAFSPDGRFLLTATANYDAFFAGNDSFNDPVIEVWELATDQLRDTFRGHTGAITRLVFSPDGETLASGSMDTTVLLWDFHGRGPSKLPPLTADDMPAAWKSLAAGDETVSAAIRRMMHAPAPTLAYFRKNLLPAKSEDVAPPTIATLVAELGSVNFQTRDHATRELRRLRRRVEDALTKASDGAPLETRRRIQELLDEIARDVPTPADLQAIRAIEVLERIGNAEAREQIRTLAAGDPFARATSEARAALARLLLFVPEKR